MGNILADLAHSDTPEDRNLLLSHVWTQIRKDRWKRIVLAGASSGPPAGALQPDRTRLFLIMSGCRHVQIAQNRRVIDEMLYPGDILFCSSGSWHAVIKDRNHIVISLIFDKNYTALAWKVRDRKGERILRVLAPPQHSPCTRNIIAALEALVPENFEPLVGHYLLKSLLLMALTEFQEAGNLPGISQRKLNSICDYLEDNYNLPLDRQLISEKFDIHPNHLSRLFQQIRGETFSHFLTRIRLAQADRLLQGTDQSVKEIAHQCGFSCDNYFNKVYRQNRGTSPARFRSICKQEV